MSPKKKITIIIPSVAILIALFFIPINEFFGINSYNEESPSPIMILENSDDILMGFKITPIGCVETSSGLTESQFQITNTHEGNFLVKVKISFTDNEKVLYEKQESIEILSGQTINQNQLSDKVYDNPICVVQIVDWSEI